MAIDSNNLTFTIQKIWTATQNLPCAEAIIYFENNSTEKNHNFYKHLLKIMTKLFISER